MNVEFYKNKILEVLSDEASYTSIPNSTQIRNTVELQWLEHLWDREISARQR